MASDQALNCLSLNLIEVDRNLQCLLNKKWINNKKWITIVYYPKQKNPLGVNGLILSMLYKNFSRQHFEILFLLYLLIDIFFSRK